MNKSLLVFSHTIPYPLVTGGKIRYYHLLRCLAERFDLSLLSLARDGEDPSCAECLRSLCREVRVIPFHKANPSFIGKIRNILSLHPADLNFEDYRAAREFSEMLKIRVVDGVLFFSSFLASYVRLVPHPAKTVLDLEDLQFIRIKRAVEKFPWGRKKIGYLLEPLKAKRFERLILGRFDLAFTCSEVDKRRVLDLGTGIPVEIVPNGVDPDQFNTGAFEEWPHPSMVYSGGLGSQGGDGVLRFIREIYPLIRKQVPEVRLHLVGGHILPELEKTVMGDSSVELVGAVEDVRPYMAGGWVFIVPLWVGSGTRLKILEASAMEKAIVSTQVGAEGLDLTSGDHLFIENTNSGFAARCVRLLREPELRRKVGRHARQAVCSRYRWSDIGSRAADILEDLIG